jgi:carboxypeptidase C (cathepsin A)
MKQLLRALSAAILYGLLTCACLAASPCEAAGPKKAADEQSSAQGLPPEVATSHSMALNGGKLNFTARAGALHLRDANTGALQADVAFVSYERADANPETRPVVFAFNGGPGSASAWLGLGALSPWRIRLGDPFSPSAAPLLMDNAENWLAFADLVLIDPPGAGYSKIVADNEELRKRFYSVQGDADAMAVAVREWLTARHRLASPKYLVGESYGGLRVIKLLHALREHESIGVSGLILVSPVLDFAWLDATRNPLTLAAFLPSYAAVARGAKDEAALADVEAYASGDYVRDLLKGVNDKEAMSRLAADVAKFTGLDSGLTARLGGRIDVKTFTRERRRSSKEVLSAYDADIAGYDPAPFSRDSDWADPVLDSLRPPFGEAMARLVAEKLQWPVGDSRYEILNDQVSHDWDYGRRGRTGVEVASDLREALALDPRVKVLVAHGAADLVTPYFATKLILAQTPSFGDQSRVQFLLLPGGHMPYLRDDSRRILRDAARAEIEGK